MAETTPYVTVSTVIPVVFTTPISVFTMPRSECSRTPIPAFTNSDPGVHDAAI